MLWRVVLASLLMVTSLALPSRAESFAFEDTSWEGTSELVRLARQRLGPDRVVVVGALDWERLSADDGVLVLHPARDVDYVEASAFLRAGGRLAILDDFGHAGPLFERFRIHRVDAPRHPAESIRNNPHLAVAKPSVQVVAGQEQGRHPIVASVGRLVTNHPTGLTHPNLTPVLTIPAIDEPDVTLAVTGIIAEKGRLLAMGDPSAVINLMLRYPGNRAFAEGLVDYLVEDDAWGERGGKLYLLANDFPQQGSFNGEGSLAKELANQLDALEERLMGMHEGGIPSPVALVLAALVALGAVAWTLTTSARPYRRAVPRYARPTHVIAQGGAAGRVALLAAPTTHRALALLELKSALEEGAALRLGLPATAGEVEILYEIDRQEALPQQSSVLLRSLLADLRQAEAAVVAAKPLRVTALTVEKAHEKVEAVLKALDARMERAT